MAFAFVLVWIPQFAYWKFISGKFFYFSYGETGGSFYFNNPQIWKILFSYEKGWFVYTPIMFFAVIGIFLLRKNKGNLAWPIGIYVTLMIYVLSSWWCWWYGGSFGQRSMVDFYGLMAIPLAAFFEKVLSKAHILKIAGIFVFIFLVFLNQFNIKQFNHRSLHYWWMNKEAYWENFLIVEPTCKFWHVILLPDYKKARLGIYEAIPSYKKEALISEDSLQTEIIRQNIDNNILIDSLRVAYQDNNVSQDSLLYYYAQTLVKSRKAEKYFKDIRIKYYLKQIHYCESWHKEMERKAKRKNISYKEMAQIEANRVYTKYSFKYDQR
jgi:hypothetical protein